MLAEEKAMLVPSLDEFVRSDRIGPGVELRSPSPATARESMLINRLRAGEMSAFEEIVELFSPLVYALAFRILNDREDARDVAQETFLKVFRHFERFRGDASLKTWICKIAINQARTTDRWWRRRSRAETVSLDEPIAAVPDSEERLQSDFIPSRDASPEAVAIRSERARQIEQALARLKKDFRVAVLLRDLEGLAYDEIAYALGISVGTVKSRIARGREMLRVELEKAGHLDSDCRQDRESGTVKFSGIDK